MSQSPTGPGQSSLFSLRSPLHCTALHCVALHCNALCCTVLHCAALHCATLHCTVRHLQADTLTWEGDKYYFEICFTKLDRGHTCKDYNVKVYSLLSTLYCLVSTVYYLMFLEYCLLYHNYCLLFYVLNLPSTTQ